MKIINIVDNATSVNTGIWGAAVATAKDLKTKFDIDSELWFPRMDEELSIPFCTALPLESTNIKSIEAFILKRGLTPKSSIIITHGCWQFPTRWGNKFKSLGYKWVHVPQGMLEPWSLSQKKWLKFFYFLIFEKPKIENADIVRAVSSPEEKNLKRRFKTVVRIPNCVTLPEKSEIYKKENNPILFLFMARLHHKKGIMPLIEGWKLSILNNHPNYKLIVAGPDQGELENILPLMQSTNIEYLGMVKGKDKQSLLSRCKYFILPSLSEGFPTSVLEAMSYGMHSFISKGCNFPEAIKDNLAVEIPLEKIGIAKILDEFVKGDIGNSISISEKNYEYIDENYSVKKISNQQYTMFKKLLAIN